MVPQPGRYGLTVPDPDLQIRGERGGGSHPDPEIKGGLASKKKCFWPIGPQFGLTIRGKEGSGPLRSLPWTRHYINNNIVKKLHAAGGCHSFISSVGKIGQH